MKKTYLFSMLFWSLFASCGNDGYHKIGPEEARRIMRETTGCILLDVRTESEYREMRIPDSRLIPDYAISTRAPLELPDKNAVILVYCRSGRRSAGASRELIKMGYTQVYDFGGIMNWPYETVDGPEK